MKRILKSKRGMAIESAIMFMLVAFMLGMLLTGISMTMHLRIRLNDKTIANEMVLEQIGENFVKYSLGDFKVDFDANYKDKYSYSYDEEKLANNILQLENKYTRVLLYIEKDGAGKVVKWQYSEPEQQS